MRTRIPGLVQSPLRSTACMHASRGTAQSVPTGTATKILLTTLEFDAAGNFDSGNSRFVARSPGYYFVSGSVASVGMNWPAGALFIIKIAKTGVDVFSSYTSVGAAATSEFKIAACSGTIYLNAGDYLELLLHHTFGSNVDTNQACYTFLSAAGPL